MTQSQKQQRIEALEEQNEDITVAITAISRCSCDTLNSDDPWVKKQMTKLVAGFRRKQEKNKIRIAELLK